MNIDQNLLNKLEKLSALKVDENQREATIAALSEVLEFANILNEIDTSSVSASGKEFTPLREDVARSSGVIAEVLAHAPAREGAYFAVPKIIE